MNGNSQLSKFKSGHCAYSTGVVALSCSVNSQKYATCVSVGEYNNPWLGDTFDLATSKAAYGAIVAAARAAHDGEDFEAPFTFDQYLVREIGDRIAYERAQVLAIRQQEWDAANSFLFSALLGSVRDVDHAIIRAHQDDGASAWQALRAEFAGAASSRSGLISALDSLHRFQCPAADNYAQTADKVSVQIGYIRNNQLIQNSSASDLLDVIQLATTMQISNPEKETRYGLF